MYGSEKEHALGSWKNADTGEPDRDRKSITNEVGELRPYRIDGQVVVNT